MDDEPWDFEYDDDDDYERDELEEAMDECGMMPEELGGGCTLAGSEHCEFDCPFRREMDEEPIQEP